MGQERMCEGGLAGVDSEREGSSGGRGRGWGGAVLAKSQSVSKQNGDSLVRWIAVVV